MATVKRIVVVHPTHEVHYTKVKANLWKIAHIQDGCCPVSGNPMEHCKTCSSCNNNTITSQFLCMNIHHSELHSQMVTYYDKDNEEMFMDDNPFLKKAAQDEAEADAEWERIVEEEMNSEMLSIRWDCDE